MPERVTMEAVLLPDRRVATTDSSPIVGARWRAIGCTGDGPAAICFITARVDGERWYTKTAPGAPDTRETGLTVTFERFLKRPAMLFGR